VRRAVPHSDPYTLHRTLLHILGNAIVGAPQEDFVYPHPIHVHDLDAQVAPRERVAGLRDASEASEDEARDRVIVAAGHITAIETPLQLFDRQMPVDEPGAVGSSDRFGTFAAAEVGQLARDCLQNVYWCRDAFDLAVLVGDDREMRARALKL